MERVGFHQRPAENLAHVIIAALARRFMKFHLQWGIKQHRFALDQVDILLELLHFMGPVFRYNKQRLRGHLLNMLDPRFIKPGGDMLDRVKTKTVAAGLLHYPARPVFDLLGHCMIAEIDIGAHQIVKVAELIIDLFIPAFAGVIVDDFKHTVFRRVLDVVNAAKTFVVPDKLRILSGAHREGVARPCLALNDLLVNLRTILLIDALNAQRLFFISAHFMVYHHIQQHGDIVLLQGVDRRQQLRFVAIFGGDRPFLIKLAEVKEIVGIIADGVTARGAFVGGWQPDHIDADFIQAGRQRFDLRPQLAAGGVVPVKTLQ
ncbi:hypothetical protein UUU_24610 [Klebsiella pneumoniae subsp. pneumoniae DSM 30104 = JCM 1662 = NBRC 14940]|nr:hypothetical protein UUU_24610 [Klebsiella pneumoniae subsp. pneumoniae DSM 30104 = JCM 1662 = NBRC 14940]